MNKIIQLLYFILIILLGPAFAVAPAEIEMPVEIVIVEEDTTPGYVEELSQLQYEARYIFEQMILPRSIFAGEPGVFEQMLLPESIFADGLETETVITLIQTANVEDMRQHVLSCWEIATTNVIWVELVVEQGAEPPNSEAEIISRANDLRSDFGLGDEHIVDVSFEKIDDGTSAFIIQLLDTNTAWLSTYIGIAYNEAMGVRIFTLEGVQDVSGEGVGAHMFCFIEDGFRGSFHTIENDRQAFIDNIRDAMNELIEPGARFPRP